MECDRLPAGDLDEDNVHRTWSLTSLPVWFWILLFPAVFARVTIAWLPLEISFVLTVPDDGYYYFSIARNIARGFGVSADGITLTNGFHPLWMFLIVPLWIVAGHSETLPVHLALTLGALVDCLTVLLIVRLAMLLTRRERLAALGGLCYAWNPYVIGASVNGLETSLATFLLAVALLQYWRLRGDPLPTPRGWLLLGMSWALLILARTDFAVILLPCAAELMWLHRRRIFPMTYAALGSVVWLPWLVWNYRTFGSFTQISGKAYPYYLHEIWRAGGHTWQEWVGVEIRMAYGIVANLARYSGFDKAIVGLAIAIVGLSVLSWVRRDAGKHSTWTIPCPALTGLIWPTVGAGVLLFFHGLVRWMYVPWYFVPMTMLLVMWFVVVAGVAARRRAVYAYVLMGALLGFQLVAANSVVRHGGMWPDQAWAVQDVERLTQKCTDASVLGISDSGFFGYMLPCRVINLDGVVNNAAHMAIREGRFRDYLDEAGIGYVMMNHIIQDVVAIREGSLPEYPPFSR